MRFVDSESLKPGMISLKNIYDKNGVCLLAANHVISKEIIMAIRRLNYPGIFVYDKFHKFEDVVEIFSEKERQQTIMAMKTLDIDKVLYYSTALVKAIDSMDDVLIDLQQLKLYKNDIYEHGINVGMLSAACGLGLGLSDNDMKELTMAAVLHDIGKNLIPESVLYKKGSLDPSERKVIENHPQLGYDLLYDNPKVSSYVRSAILHHHENEDGSGYPDHLTGDKIPLFSKIIHIADVYDAMVQERVYKKGFEPSEVAEYLMGNAGTMFDLNILKTFLQYLVVYPVGTDVMLSNNNKARVVKNRQNFVFRPVVIQHKDKKRIDLAMDRNYYNLTIIKSGVSFHEGDLIGSPGAVFSFSCV